MNTQETELLMEEEKVQSSPVIPVQIPEPKRHARREGRGHRTRDMGVGITS